MPELPAFEILLVEPATLLRRTVSLTVRSLGTASVTDLATYGRAHQFCSLHRIDGAVIALDWPPRDDLSEGLTLIQSIRSGACACEPDIPIAVLVEACNAALLQVLAPCRISRILIKPFRARDVIDTIAGMRKQVSPVAAG